MTLLVVVAIVELCNQVAQDRLRVGESDAVVLVVGRVVAETERQIGRVIPLVVDDIRPVVVLVLVFAERTIQTETDVTSVAASHS